ncbi:hypothetical protein GCM10022222_54480 [Amycolatopsis ultiminotia]|uniref:Antitoxin VbhA domain-containing protein n=1 Tax=Amycolatopsis ultiminotia TaxID=543629 RepID=A0ABP6XC16_9PSEU
MPPPPRWSLPDNPELDWLRIRAKQLRDAAAEVRLDALELVDSYDPPGSGPVTLARAQRVVARAYGSAGW